MFHPVLEVSPVVPLKLFCNVGMKNDSGPFLAFQGGLLHNVVFRPTEKHLVLNFCSFDLWWLSKKKEKRS